LKEAEAGDYEDKASLGLIERPCLKKIILTVKICRLISYLTCSHDKSNEERSLEEGLSP
jgi:hypothetical protein